jgi:hypothetical protein
MRKFSLFRSKPSAAHILLTDFISKHLASGKFDEGYKRRYRNVIMHLKRFQEYSGIAIYVDSVTEYALQEFVHYLRSSGRTKGVKKNGEGLMLNSVAVICERVTHMLVKASKRYRLSVELTVSVPKEDACAVYLTLDELQRLNALQGLSKEAKAVRDLFLVGCFTALRYSDYSHLTIGNIVGGNIEVKTRKTGAKVVIPIHPVAQQVLDRNGGEFPKPPSQQSFGETIKRVCKRAGVTDEVLYERTVGVKIVRKRVPKYTLISSHTARRTAATNMYLAGMPTFRIMLITGHTTEESFFKYIRIGRAENAKTLAEHSFFKNFGG